MHELVLGIAAFSFVALKLHKSCVLRGHPVTVVFGEIYCVTFSVILKLLRWNGPAFRNKGWKGLVYEGVSSEPLAVSTKKQKQKQTK